MTGGAIQIRPAAIRALGREIVGADDPQMVRVVAMVDAMISRGPADALIAPARPRLALLRPAHPLRFTRLLFHPLDRLIAAPAGWQFGQQTIPRTALRPMAEHVRLAMGEDAAWIEAALTGRTTADTALIGQLGRSLWPAAALILADAGIPDGWAATELGEAAYRPLAGIVSVLMNEAAMLDTLCSDTATGLLPPTAAVIAALLGRVAAANRGALPMMITLLLDHLPEAADLLQKAKEGQDSAGMRVAMDQATEFLVGRLDQPNDIEIRIAAGTLAEAGVAASRIAMLVGSLERSNAKPNRRDRLRAMRQRLDAGCMARFVAALEDDLLTPLQHLGSAAAVADVNALETAARALRVLETGGRMAGGGAAYDLLLGKAAEAIKGMSERLGLVDRLRLVEILGGSEAALAMFDEA